MNFRKLHLPSVGILGLILGGLFRILAFSLQWPILLVYLSNVTLLLAVGWILMFDLLPILIEPFYYISRKFSRRRSFFVALLLLFVVMMVINGYLPSGRAKDITSNLAYLSFLGACVWFIAAYVLGNFTPYIKQLKRLPRDPERVTLSDIINSIAIVLLPIIVLLFVISPTGFDRTIVTPTQVFASRILSLLLMMGYLVLMVIRPRVFTWKQLGIRKVDREDFGHALVLFLLISVIVVIAQALLKRLGVSLQEYSFSTTDNAWFALVATVILAPIVEELYFRGFIFRGLMLHHRPAVAYIVSSLLFALRIQPPLVIVEFMIIGLLLAYLLKETKSIWPGVMVHMLNNALVFGYLLYR